MKGTLTADGQGDYVQIRGKALFVAHGTFGSGTLVVQMQANGVGVPITDASWTADIVTFLDTGANSDIRVSLSGSSSPTIQWTITPA